MKKFLWVLGVLGLLTACGWEQTPALSPPPDLESPELVQFEYDGQGLRLGFSEEVGQVSLVRGELEIPGALGPEGVWNLVLDPPPAPGELWQVEVRAQDQAGNLGVWAKVLWGVNPHPARAVLHEVNAAGSGSHPDAVELLITAPGSLAGLTLADGPAEDRSFSFTFPDVRVEAGDLVVLHLKSFGGAGEVDELGALDQASGYDTQPRARDFWLRPSGGLTGTTGALGLLTTPEGPFQDAIIYTNRALEAGAPYQGFGSATNLRRVLWAAGGGPWPRSSGELGPQDGVSSLGITSTRTLGRKPGVLESFSREAWQICPTSAGSMGLPNSEKAYTP